MKRLIITSAVCALHSLHLCSMTDTTVDQGDQTGAGGAAGTSPVDDLQVAVTNTESVIDSAVTLITGLAERLKVIATQPPSDIGPQVDALANELSAKADVLAQAVVDNTPAA